MRECRLGDLRVRASLCPSRPTVRATPPSKTLAMDFRREVLELLRSGDAHEMGHAARAELQPHHRRVQSEVSVDLGSSMLLVLVPMAIAVGVAGSRTA